MKRKNIMLFFALSLLVACKSDKAKAPNLEKYELIYGENNYDFVSLKLRFYSDDSYVFDRYQNRSNYIKTEKLKGFFKFRKDTIDFSPFPFEWTGSTKAVIKNNFIEFVDGKNSIRIAIKKNSLSNNSLKVDMIENYSIFTFDERDYDYMPGQIKAYDLKQGELERVDKILKKCFDENSVELKKIENYIKQCVAVINEKGEREVWVKCFCRDSSLMRSYTYKLIHMSDGGNCNVRVKINLTKNGYSELRIAGEA